MRLKKIIMVFVSLALINCIPYAVAQDEDNDRLAHLILITAKDGHNKALEEAITKYHHYMGDKEGAFRYTWYSIITGPNAGKYIARSGGHNWADFDATHDWDDAADAKFASDVQPHIADADVQITQTDDEVGIWPESMEGYQYFSITKWHIKPGHGNEFNEGLKKIDATLKDGGWPNFYAFSNAVSGGDGNSTTLISPRKSFADMAPKEPSFYDVLNKAMGEEEAKTFLADWSTTYKSGQNQLIKILPEQSDYGDSK
jgi:quinol monooxygenase YgiN